MENTVPSDAIPVVALGVLGWALCGAIMFIGMAVTSMEATLIIHAIGAPIIFGVLAWIYHRRFRRLSPLHLAAGWVLLVMAVDFFLVALVINRSLDMFRSPLGTWIPFGLIFLSTYLVGRTTGAPRQEAWTGA